MNNQLFLYGSDVHLGQQAEIVLLAVWEIALIGAIKNGEVVTVVHVSKGIQEHLRKLKIEIRFVAPLRSFMIGIRLLSLCHGAVPEDMAPETLKISETIPLCTGKLQVSCAIL
jgi:hypothetical protein